ncbi:MAG: VOC family protein [Deltaproteobacteria bacterium]|nr:VOC family protein [Deltaproteobacteria bacterium]
MADTLVFHHVGVITDELDAAVEFYRGLGYAPGPTYADDVQKLTIIFVEKAGSPLIELIRPLGDESPARDWIGRITAGAYHTAYTARDFDAAVGEMKKKRMKKVLGPVPAVAFGGKRVAFFWNTAVGLVELVES